MIKHIVTDSWEITNTIYDWWWSLNYNNLIMCRVKVKDYLEAFTQNSQSLQNRRLTGKHTEESCGFFSRWVWFICFHLVVYPKSPWLCSLFAISSTLSPFLSLNCLKLPLSGKFIQAAFPVAWCKKVEGEGVGVGVAMSCAHLDHDAI